MLEGEAKILPKGGQANVSLKDLPAVFSIPERFYSVSRISTECDSLREREEELRSILWASEVSPIPHVGDLARFDGKKQEKER